MKAGRKKLAENKEHLKRTVSMTTPAPTAEREVKKRILALEVEKEEYELDKLSAERDFERGLLDRGAWIATHKATHARVSSVGEALFKERRNLREVEESLGMVAKLTPDLSGPFTAALLRLYHDPDTSRKRNRTQQSNMRRDAIALYESRPQPEDDAHRLRCVVTGKLFEAQEVVAAHIVPQHLGVELADYIFGSGGGARLFSADNCMMMHRIIERSFDKGHIIILPVDPQEEVIRRWKIVFTNKAAKNQYVWSQSETLGTLDGCEVSFRTKHRPAARFLYFHFVVTLLRLRAARRDGWEEIWAEYAGTNPWPTPGKYLRRSMLLAMARQTTYLEEEELERLMLDQTFAESVSLSGEEEAEIARRIEVCTERKEERHEGGESDTESSDDDGEAKP